MTHVRHELLATYTGASLVHKRGYSLYTSELVKETWAS